MNNTMTPLRPYEMEAVLAVPLKNYFGTTFDRLSNNFDALLVEALDSLELGVPVIALGTQEYRDVIVRIRKEIEAHSPTSEDLNAVTNYCGYRLRMSRNDADKVSHWLEAISLAEEIRGNYFKAKRYAHLRLLLESKRKVASASECALTSSGYRLIDTGRLIESLASIARIERKLSNYLKVIEILKVVSALKAEPGERSEISNVITYVSRMANPTIFEQDIVTNLEHILWYCS